MKKKRDARLGFLILDHDRARRGLILYLNALMVTELVVSESWSFGSVFGRRLFWHFGRFSLPPAGALAEVPAFPARAAAGEREPAPPQ